MSMGGPMGTEKGVRCLVLAHAVCGATSVYLAGALARLRASAPSSRCEFAQILLNPLFDFPTFLAFSRRRRRTLPPLCTPASVLDRATLFAPPRVLASLPTEHEPSLMVFVGLRRRMSGQLNQPEVAGRGWTVAAETRRRILSRS